MNVYLVRSPGKIYKGTLISKNPYRVRFIRKVEEFDRDGYTLDGLFRIDIGDGKANGQFLMYQQAIEEMRRLVLELHVSEVDMDFLGVLMSKGNRNARSR